MASSGSSGRAASGSRSFEFGSDDVLCSYDDLGNQEPSTGKLPDSSVQDFRESGMGRPLVNVYSQQEDFNKQDVIYAVEKCMKEYADNLLRFLEGISGRLSQLELYCYNLERSIGEFRSDLIRHQGEADQKLKSMEKHLQEVFRSLQILRDKQELAETQKELAKLQLVQKESSKGVAPSASEQKKLDDSPDAPNQQLALALPRQTTMSTLPATASEQNQPYKDLPVQQPPPSSVAMQQDPYILNQARAYSQHNQMLTLPVQSQQHQQNPSVQPELQYVRQRPPTQDLSGQAAQQQPLVTKQTQPHSFPQYQQQWSQQFPQQAMQPQQQATPHSQIRPQVPPMYPTYTSQQPTNASPETFQGSMPMQVPYSVPQSSGNRLEAVPFGYGGSGSLVQPSTGPGSTVQAPPPHHNMPRQPQPQTSQSSFGPYMSKSSFEGSTPYSTQTNVQGYIMFGNDPSRTSHPQNFHPGSYPPTSISSLQNQLPPPVHHSGPQLVRNHPYGEVIEKAVSMGYPRDQVVSVVLRMEESGQPVDFNSLLDRLNARLAGASPRGWSG